MAEATTSNSSATLGKRRRDRKVEATTPGQTRKQRSPQRDAKDKSPYGKYIFKYSGGGSTVIYVKTKWAELLKFTEATADMETGVTEGGRANHEHRGVKHGKTLTIYPKAPTIIKGRYKYPDQFQLQVPSDANYNDIVTTLNSLASEIWAFKWGSTTSFYYRKSVGAAGTTK